MSSSPPPPPSCRTHPSLAPPPYPKQTLVLDCHGTGLQLPLEHLCWPAPAPPYEGAPGTGAAAAGPAGPARSTAATAAAAPASSPAAPIGSATAAVRVVVVHGDGSLVADELVAVELASGVVRCVQSSRPSPPTHPAVWAETNGATQAAMVAVGCARGRGANLRHPPLKTSGSRRSCAACVLVFCAFAML